MGIRWLSFVFGFGVLEKNPAWCSLLPRLLEWRGARDKSLNRRNPKVSPVSHLSEWGLRESSLRHDSQRVHRVSRKLQLLLCLRYMLFGTRDYDMYRKSTMFTIFLPTPIRLFTCRVPHIQPRLSWLQQAETTRDSETHTRTKYSCCIV